ncbi:MAG: sporulation initiation factor Spo0A C-terminal domain-containing protein [Oscillospiraceae bacterium]|nr:sporulation initiation factor Spo0A C-terminal domain-containing protein [Oscillospiraceae bacterium]
MDAEQILRRLGISGQLKGFHFATYMVERVAEDPTALLLITKCLYAETAKHFRVSASVVERDVRVLIRTCWDRGDRAFLESVAGTHISQRPTNSEFLDMLAAFLRQQSRI